MKDCLLKNKQQDSNFNMNIIKYNESCILIYLSLLYLFDANPTNHLLSTVVVSTKWVWGYFANLKENKNLYKSLSDFYFIWVTNKINKWKNFRLTPLFRLGRLHFNYNTVALYQLLSSIEECPKTESLKTGNIVNMSAAQFQSPVVFRIILIFLKQIETIKKPIATSEAGFFKLRGFLQTGGC